MTAIAISDGLVACDTQVTGGNYAVRAVKLVRLPDGGVAAGAGLWCKAYRALQWLANGEPGEAPDLDGAVVVIVRPDKSIWIAEGMFPAYPILDTDYAAGCAQDLIRAFMEEGHGPLEAIAKACELDAVSSAPIVSMSVQSAPEFDGPAMHSVERVERKPKRVAKKAAKRK